MQNESTENTAIGLIGLGYVGLPLACMFARKYPVVGYDINAERVDEINRGIDRNGDLSDSEVAQALGCGLRCTTEPDALRQCTVYVVAVPTPVDDRHRPDLQILHSACQLVGRYVAPGNIVVFESTVSPGVTEEFCVPVIEQASGLRLNSDFFVGYSPERINPGDHEHRIENICKITSGSTPEIAQRIDRLYASVLSAGTCPVASIKVAEAAKILENTQRDVNIALMNEMTMVFDKMGVDIYDVIEAAATKWNFLHFLPGLVGGHCIGVDPYYLIKAAGDRNCFPILTIAARLTNESMGRYIADRLVDEMTSGGIVVKQSRILLVGFSFKEDVRDTRNTKVADIYHRLQLFADHVTVYDPNVCAADVAKGYGIPIATDVEELTPGGYDAVVYCVTHSCFSTLDLRKLCRNGGLIYDVKGAFHTGSQFIWNNQSQTTKLC